MIICRLMTTLFITVLHTMTGDCSNENPSITRDTIHVNVGKRVRMECELANSITTSNMKGLWVRLEDAEIFFYATTRVHPDERFQIEQRPILHILNGTSSYEAMTYSLTIDDIRLSDDGTYSCQADNRIIKLFVLNVVERPYFVTQEYSTLLRTQIGKNVSIACEAQGKPSPFVSWIKKMDDNHQKTMINCTTTPTICQMNLLNVDRWHHGIYECVATNTIATISRFYKLDVQFPPDVQTSTSNLLYSIGDTITLHCFIDANPEPDIRWLHRLNNDINQQIDVLRHIDQGILNTNYHPNSSSNGHRRMIPSWSIEQEQINATRWKTTLIIKHLPKRYFNSSLICRAVNRHGEDEKSILILPNHHHHHHPHASKKHRHTSTAKITTLATSTLAFEPSDDKDEQSLSFTTHSSSQDLKEMISNHSRRLSLNLFYSFILGLCFVVAQGSRSL